MSHRNDPTLSSHIFNHIFCHINPFRFLDYRNRAGLLGKNRYNRIHKHLRLKKTQLRMIISNHMMLPGTYFLILSHFSPNLSSITFTFEHVQLNAGCLNMKTYSCKWSKKPQDCDHDSAREQILEIDHNSDTKLTQTYHKLLCWRNKIDKMWPEQ